MQIGLYIGFCNVLLVNVASAMVKKMLMKLFLCGDCSDKEKENIRKLNIEVKTFDITTKDGMAESEFYDIEETPSAVLVDDNEEEIESWRGLLPDYYSLRLLEPAIYK